VDGVSLTVAACGRDWFEVALIPETLGRTTLGGAAPGTDVNLEADVVARHVARLREFAPAAGPGVGADDLSRWGYGGAP
jgi:riboflavin synthase